MLFAVRCWWTGLPYLVFIPADTREEAEVILAETFDLWNRIAAEGGLVPATATDGEVLWICIPGDQISTWPSRGDTPRWSEGVDLSQGEDNQNT